MSPGRTTVH